MAIRRIILDNFRNHRAVDIEAGNAFVVLVGANGCGKTNVLEALSLLAPGRGLRGAPLSEMARIDGPGGFTVLADLDDARIGIGTRPDRPDRREVRVNGALAPSSQLGEWLSILWLTPAMDRLFTEAASGRRRFLDRMVLALYPGHAAHSSRYDRALRERNRLLSGDPEPDTGWMDALEASMAEHGAAIEQARHDVLAELAILLANAPDSPFARAELLRDADLPPDADVLRAQWRQGRAADRRAGRTLTGPHRADLTVLHAAKSMPAARCSTGEQKALLLCIVLAHADLVRARFGAPPVLLLDEVAAHLDELRRTALFRQLAEMGGQVWLTGTDLAMFDAISDRDCLLFTEAGIHRQH